MISLEQVKLLETKVAKAIDYVNHLTGENAMLKEKLTGYQTRIDELEVLIKRFKEDQGRIEGGILSALDRLNQFEDAIEKGISQLRPSDELNPKEEKNITSNPSAASVSSSFVENEEISVPSIENDDNLEATLFSEITPAADFDDASEDDAAIMAALENEEKALKAKKTDEQSAELDIF
ncbi:MAG: cell division protein ZapB [Treponema sp.]|jgi:FtsZ-binding cell division protein ZapB|nr:cell division protein ZapB [Treponema sp.]